MNNKNLAVCRTSTLVRVWRSTGDPRMPLVGIWVQAETVKLLPAPVEPSSDEIGGLRLCA
jgi:hypothetical protein